MTNRFTILVALTAIMFGCKTSDNADQTPPDTIKTFQLSTTTFESQSTTENIEEICAYVFHKNTFVRALRNIEKDKNGNISVAVPAGSKLFFLTNTPEPASYSILTQGKTSLSDFLALTTAASATHSATHAPEFFSGTYDVSAEASESGITKISLLRSVARLDMDASRDELIKVSRLVVENANAVTNLFSTSSPAALSQMSYEQSFDPAINGVSTDLFRIYESSTPVKVTLYGTYNSMPIVIPITIPKIERNKVYTLRILNAGTTITGSFEVAPWGDGGAVDGLPDVAEKIKISQDNTQLCEGATADYQANVVNVSATGGEFTLGFVGAAKIDLASIDGAHAEFGVDLVSSESTQAGVVTKYKVTIQAQGKGRLPYTVTLNLKSVLVTNSYDQVSINVAQSPYQIAEVTLGGKTWMAFNARSRDLDDQVYLLDGASVEDMYNNNWISTIGGLFAWGRILMYTPWIAGPGIADATQGQSNPWVADTHVPCPEGYRVPLKAELRALLPPGQAIPGSYTYNDETIDIALHTSTTATISPINGVGGTAKYVTLTSNTSGAQLIIPLAGHKGDKSTTKDPGFGLRFMLWAADRTGATSGWAWTAKFDGSSNQIASDSQLQAEGYASVRCLKK